MPLGAQRAIQDKKLYTSHTIHLLFLGKLKYFLLAMKF